jgi:hypothetical protein
MRSARGVRPSGRGSQACAAQRPPTPTSLKKSVMIDDRHPDATDACPSGAARPAHPCRRSPYPLAHPFLPPPHSRTPPRSLRLRARHFLTPCSRRCSSQRPRRRPASEPHHAFLSPALPFALSGGSRLFPLVDPWSADVPVLDSCEELQIRRHGGSAPP